MKLSEPATRFTPGFISRFTSCTSFVALAIVSPTGCESWNAVLLPSRLMYSSSRISRSSRSPITALEKLRPSCNTARTVWLPITPSATKPMVRKSAGDAKAASNATPIRTGTNAASAALPKAPINMPAINNLWCERWDKTQRLVVLWSVCCDLLTSNSLKIRSLCFRMHLSI